MRCFLLGLGVWLAGTLVAASGGAVRAGDPLHAPPVGRVKAQDTFWAPKFQVIRERTIPHSWHYMQWNERALRHAAGQKVNGDLNGTWDEANLFKFFETVAYALAMQRDAALERRVDELVALLARAQRPDGYVHVHVINAGKPPWDPKFLDGSHDGYVLGHLIEAAIEYHAATGKTNLLNIALRAADQAYEHFLGPRGQPGFCGHAELEMALVELYRLTRQPRHLELARAFVEWRGQGKVQPAGPTPRAYFQDHLPLREQRTLEGHAVRAIFFATGVADLALETHEPDYRLAASRFWDCVTMRRMAVTGAIGPRAEHEALGEDYELPHAGYYESCAACGLVDFAHRMFLLERHAEAVDVLERVLYNAVLHGLGLSGTNSYYQNPLSDRNRPRYNSWVCCPPNLSRTLLQAGRYAYAHTSAEVYVNLYLGGTVSLPLAAGPLNLEVQTDYPWSGTVRLTMQPERPMRAALHLRWPGWCRQMTVKLNGATLEPLPARVRGYVRLDREWRAGEVVELELAMPVERMVAHPNVLACRGQVALQRGPLVYGFEGLDNEGQPLVELGEDPRFQIEHRPQWLGGVIVIRGVRADGRPFLAIPFYALANRQPSSQEVWAIQRDLRLNDSWWEGRLYRPLQEVQVLPK